MVATKTKKGPKRPPYLLPNGEKLADIKRLCQPETEPAFGHEPNFFLAGSVGSRCASGRSYSRADDCTFASADQCAQQRASSGAAADESEIAFLVTASA